MGVWQSGSLEVVLAVGTVRLQELGHVGWTVVRP